jgi:hypothetical protein
VAHRTVDVFQFFIVIAVEILQVGVTVDAFDVLPSVDGIPVYFDIHEEGDHPSVDILGHVLVFVAVEAVFGGLRKDRAWHRQNGQDQPHQDQGQESFSPEIFSGRFMEKHRATPDREDKQDEGDLKK